LAVQLLKRRIEDPEYRESHLPVEQWSSAVNPVMFTLAIW
jgi:hypothetical protein